MKLHSFLLPAVAGLAAADRAQPMSHVFVLRQSPVPHHDGMPPVLPGELAEAILLQRLGQSSSLDHVSSPLADEEAVKFVNEFGKRVPALFGETEKEKEQLVIVYSGATADQSHSLLDGAMDDLSPSFVAPSIAQLPLESKKGCDLTKAVNAKNDCGSGYLHFDVAKDTKAVSALKQNLAKLQSIAAAGTTEITIVIRPQSSSSDPAELRRRQEEVMSEDSKSASSTAVGAVDSTGETSTETGSSLPTGSFHRHDWGVHLFTANGSSSLPTCFSSFNSCVAATGNCSGHGLCHNKYGETAKNPCFSCHCLKSVEYNQAGNKVTYHWGGAACQKVDISAPFWLLAGFTVVMVGAISFSIGLLFQVGEEKLPGVIGAGVSRNK